ncbi:MAG: hypothetical protein AAGB12_14630 [Pseudomonadota bacterium]
MSMTITMMGFAIGVSLLSINITKDFVAAPASALDLSDKSRILIENSGETLDIDVDPQALVDHELLKQELENLKDEIRNKVLDAMKNVRIQTLKSDHGKVTQVITQTVAKNGKNSKNVVIISTNEADFQTDADVAEIIENLPITEEIKQRLIEVLTIEE